MNKIACYLFFLLVLGSVTVHADQALYQGNTKSMIYHQKECKYYGCQSCTMIFESMKDAENAGYSPCKTCIVPFRDTLKKIEETLNNSVNIQSSPKIKTNLDSMTVPQAFINIIKNMCGLFVAQLVIFGLYNCFLKGNLGILKRWALFQCWLFGKSTESQLKKKNDRANYEGNKLETFSGVKKGMIKSWFATRHIFSWLNHFTGCFINFILFACFFILSWSDGKLILIKGWEWINTMGG